jgi:hypothetical protein
MFDIAIVIEPHEERVLRKLHKESQRSRRMRHPSVMLLRPGFDPHAVLDRLIAKILTIVIPPSYPCSSRSRSKIRFEVCCCLAG